MCVLIVLQDVSCTIFTAFGDDGEHLLMFLILALDVFLLSFGTASDFS